VARNGSPLVLGIGDSEMFFASDPAALVRHTTRVVHLDDGEIAAVHADGYETRTLEGAATIKTPSTIPWKDESFDKGEFTHYMRKEIAEQPDAVRRTLSGRLDARFQTTHLGGVELAARDLLDVRRVKILGCGAAYIAGTVGAHLIETLARIPAHAEPASEFRYRNAVVERDTLYIAVSQSGETFDTLAAVQEIKRKGGRVLGVVNVVGSTIARECGQGIYLHAGPRSPSSRPRPSPAARWRWPCWRSTSAGCAISRSPTAHGLIRALQALAGPHRGDPRSASPRSPGWPKASWAPSMRSMSGAPPATPWPPKAALKLKEVSYLHAEAYPASELKHGPLGADLAADPTVIVLPRDDLFA
jgi:glucosamine--fructose-6-phosphate aminotransferase (isomerizing)